MLVPRVNEIGYSVPEILSCHTQNAIKSSRANFVMIDYTMINELQAVLAKEMCPKLTLPMVVNTAATRQYHKIHTEQYIRSKQTVEPLNDWIDSKEDLLAWALHYPYPGCNPQVLRLQKDIQTCETKAMRMNNTSYIRGM
jgi:hypothetical protein